MKTRLATAREGRWTAQLGRLLEGAVRRKRLAAMVAAGLAVAIVAGLLTWQPTRPPQTGAVPSPTATASPAATGQPASPPAPDGRTAVARLEASDESGGTVPLDASYRLTSLDGTPAADLAARIAVEPSVTFDIVPESDPSTVRLVPTTPLAPGTVYRFDLTGGSAQLLDFVGLPGTPGRPRGGHASRQRGDERPAQHRHRDHVRPGRRQRCGRSRHDLARGRRPVRAARPCPRLRSQGARAGDGVHRVDLGRRHRPRDRRGQHPGDIVPISKPRRAARWPVGWTSRTTSSSQRSQTARRSASGSTRRTTAG